MLDTVPIEGGKIDTYFATDKKGFVSGTPITWSTLLPQFLGSSAASYKRQLSLQPDLASLPIAIAHTATGAITLLDFAALESLTLSQSPSPDVIALSRFIRPRGINPLTLPLNTPTPLGNFHTTFALPSGVAVFKYTKATPTGSTRCLNTRVNAAMRTMLTALISRLESSKGVRVVSLHAVFLVDVDDEIHLVNATDVCTTEPAESMRRLDRDRQHNVRMKGSQKIEANMEKAGKMDFETSTFKDMSHGGVGGSRSENRLLTRNINKLNAEPDEQLVTLIMNEESASAAMKKNKQIVGKARDLERRQSVSEMHKTKSMIHLLESVNKDSDPTPKSPNRARGSPSKKSYKTPSFSRTDLEITKISRSTAAAAALGSSQIDGCPGDFCDTHLSIDRALDGVTKQYDHLSEFRRKLLERESEEISDQTKKRKKRKADDKATPKKKKIAPDGSTLTLEDQDDCSPTQPIPLKSIIQARHERHFVDILLMRLRQHEEGDYLQSLDDLSLGQTFPGHYYKHTHVCKSCHTVYTLVDEHRTRAINKLKAGEVYKPRPHTVADSPTKRSMRLYETLAPPSLDKENSALTFDAGDALDEPSLAPVESNAESEEVKGMLRAYEAIENLEKTDVAELRSFVNPPPAVVMVTSVLMILLQNNVLPWSDAKKLMSNGDRFLNMLLDFDADSITQHQITLLRPFEANPNFHPDAVAPICLCAAKFLSWCIGMLNAYRWKRGEQHARIDPLKSLAIPNPDSPNAKDRKMPKIAFKQASSNNPAKKTMTFADKLKRRKAERDRNKVIDAATLTAPRPSTSPVKRSKGSDMSNLDSVWAEIEEEKRGRKDRSKRMANKNKSIQPLEVGFGRTTTHTNIVNVSPLKINNFQQAMLSSKAHPLPPSHETMMPITAASMDFDQSLTGFSHTHSTAPRVLTKREKHAKSVAQKTQMDRLASRPSENIEMEPNGTRKIMCEDEQTRLCYSISGSLSMEAKSANFVVCHDFFDHHVASNMNLKHLSKKHPGSQFLCWNYPGQADTTWPNLSDSERAHGGEEQKLTAEFIADRLHELLQHVECCGEMLVSSPFHIIGFGFGSMIAATFASKYGKMDLYRRSLRSVVSVNGFTNVDAQLAAIMHSSINVFKAFPSTRPDLPVSYFTQFLFGEEYLRKVNKNLAMNIYTAIPNPITINGRIRLCKGVLASTKVTDKVKGLGIPTVVLQSTDNIMVNASNVDPFLTGRAANHLWSHEIKMSNPENKSCLGKRGIELLEETMGRPYGAFVAWVKGGHEIKQENKRFVLDVMDCLCQIIWGIEGDAGATVGALSSVGNLNQGNYDGATGVAKGTLVPSDDFLSAVRAVEDRVEGEEKKEDEEPEESVLSILDDGWMTATQMQERIESEAREAEEKVARDEIERQNAEIKGRLQHETDSLFVGGGEVETAKSAGEKLFKMQSDIEAELAEAMKETVDAVQGSAAANMLSGDELLANLDLKLEDANLMSSVNKIKEEAEQREKDLVEEELGVTKKRVEMGDYVQDQKELVLNLGMGDNYETKAEESSGLVVSSGKPELPPRIDENDKDVSEQVRLKQKEVEEAEAERFDAQEEFDKVMGSHQRGVVNDMKDKANLAAVPPIEALKEAEEMKEKEVKDTLSMFDAPAMDGRGSFNVSSGKVEKADTSLPVGLFTNPEDRLERDGENSDEMKANRSWVLGEKGDREGKRRLTPVLRSADEVLEEEGVIEDGMAFAKRQLEKTRRAADDAANAMIIEIQREQEKRRQQYEEEDRALLKTIEMEKDQARRGRVNEDLQRRMEVERAEQKLVNRGVVGEFDAEKSRARLASDGVTGVDDPRVLNPVRVMAPTFLEEQPDLPDGLKVTVEKSEDVLSQMEAEQKEAEAMGIMRIEDFHDIKRKQAQAALDREMKLRTLDSDEQTSMFEEMAAKIQVCYRGRAGRLKSKATMEKAKRIVKEANAALKIQKCMRGKLARKKMQFIRDMEIQSLVLGGSAILLQKCFRGHVGRTIAWKKKQGVKTIVCQRVYRGHLGRRAAQLERDKLAELRLRSVSAVKIQATWKMKCAREEYRKVRVHTLAAAEIQRIYRGRIGRKTAERRKKWESTEPGPERLKLGLSLIEESKVAFERQQEEIDALHRAQNNAEARISHIHSELKDSEKELTVLERELQEIDQIESDLHELTHERKLLQMGIEGAAGINSTGIGEDSQEGGVMAGVSLGSEGTGLSAGARRDMMKQKQTESYAMEMAIHIKKAEREKKRQELEAEFTTVFAEVERKKQQLDKLEVALADMEATRLRKDREFNRLQRNLMELLEEQKYELDSLREKGIELETATATSAAAATATAMKAKEHEKASSAMYSQQEELMKFQFMSMSLTYFSSLNMLKQMRAINSDTTSSAVSATAEAAAAAAAASAAANIPSVKGMKMGAGDIVEAAIQTKRDELLAAEQAQKDAVTAKEVPFPKDVRYWSVDDVLRWLDKLALQQYKMAFKEASVDGEFLMELREQDLQQVLGMEHRLHVRKVLIQRDRLKPLSQREHQQTQVVVAEEKAEAQSRGLEAPDVATVFSQARNGRLKRLEESLNAGFPIDQEDDKGNTLLIIAAQNRMKRMIELLLTRNANINHQSALGNTALHYAMVYDTEGEIGEFLISKGADDSLENKEGMSCYDGLGGAALG